MVLLFYGVGVFIYVVCFMILLFFFLEKENFIYRVEFVLGYDISVKGDLYFGVIIKYENIFSLENKMIKMSKNGN